LEDYDRFGPANETARSVKLGAAIVHEVRTPSGASLKVWKHRSTGGEPPGRGTAARVAPIAPEIVNVLQDTATSP